MKKGTLKTLTDLRRDAKSEKLEGRIVYHWMWKEGLPERLQGWRKITDSNSVAIFFQNKDGRKSELRIERASLVDYDGETLIIYNGAERNLNEKEQHVMDEWNKIAQTEDYKKRAYYDALSDGSSTYYQKLAFFQKAGYEYLLGYEKQHGMKYEWSTGKVYDESIKGDILIKYELRTR